MMKNIFLLCTAVLTANISSAQIRNATDYPPVELKGTQLIQFRSAINDQNYEVYVELPASYKDSSKKRYPVLYVLDGQWFFPTIIEMRESMRYEGYLPEMIVIGIGWPDNYHVNRNRDFFPANTRDSTMGPGAPRFLKVLKNEIMQFVDSAYRSDQKNNVLQGQSGGGAFALYALFHDTSLFNSYIISCPSLEYSDGIFFKYEKAFSAEHHELNAKLFLTSSEYEEAMTTNSLYYKFIKQLKSSNYKGLKLETLVVEKMGHATQYAYAVGRGLQFVFGRADILMDTLLLNQYIGKYEFGITITRVGKSLYANVPDGKIKLHAETNERFYVNGVPGATVFTRDNKGKVTALTITGDGGVMTAKKLD
jgi:predicted alpha/beta superfamily hydrolase